MRSGWEKLAARIPNLGKTERATRADQGIRSDGYEGDDELDRSGGGPGSATAPPSAGERGHRAQGALEEGKPVLA
jgi:hypothetical protein